QGVLARRVSYRLGSGSRSAPRYGLIAESVTSEHRGKAFGLEGIGDNLGAFLGPLLTVLLFFSLRFDIHYIFYLAIIPGLLAFLMILFVKEKGNKIHAQSNMDLNISQFAKAYWKYLFSTVFLGFGNSTNAFLILYIR